MSIFRFFKGCFISSEKRSPGRRWIFLFLAWILVVGFVFIGGFWGAGREDARFESYCEQLFRQEVAGNSITLHFTVRNPEAYRIKDAPVSFGQVSTDVAAMGASVENALGKLQAFDREALSSENQLVYDLLEYSFSSSRALAPYALYAEPLAPLTGTQAQLPVLLSEYRFDSLEDVETYLALLQELPEYFAGILEFERAKAEAGLFMSDDRARAVIEECRAFVAMGEENYLYETFEARVGDVGDGVKSRSSPRNVENLVEKNAFYVEKYVFPAYELLCKGLQELMGSCKNEEGLCHFPDGKSYYELLVADVTGSDRSLLELRALTMEQVLADIEDMQAVLENADVENAGVDDVGEELFVEDEFLAEAGVSTNPEGILTMLRDSIAEHFPAAPEVDISVKYVDACMEDYLSPAFYLIPAIDDTERNVIYVNQKHLRDELSLFTTLAHEGYPGHLYQTTFFAETEPAAVRSLLDFGGYTEGWATYCEMMSYYLAPIDRAAATLAQKSASVMLGLYAYADMGIHSEGWSLDETAAFFADYRVTDTEAVAEIYELILGDPGNYLKYYIGYLEFLELKKAAIAAWGDEFSQERFHRMVLEVGPAPFEVLKSRVGTCSF